MFICNIVLYSSLLVEIVHSEFSESFIDMDGILDEDYMPGSILMLENPEAALKSSNESKVAEKNNPKLNGSLFDAMATMMFHRKMMNQYMCRSFLAEQIVSDMSMTRMKRRMGHVTLGIGEIDVEPSKFQNSSRNKLINDEGSTAYQNWLSKSATLEDIYRHYDMAQNKQDTEVNEEEEEETYDENLMQKDKSDILEDYQSSTHQPLKHRGHNREEIYVHDGSSGGYHQSAGGESYQHSGGGGGYQHSSGGGGYGYGGYSEHSGVGGYTGHLSGGGHAQYDFTPEVYNHVYHHHSSPPKYHVLEHKYGGKDKELAELFDIALTALAFLAFGMFLVHVVMCISSLNNGASTTITPMMAMSMSPSATAAGTPSTSTGGGGTTSTGSGTTGTGGAGGTATGTGGGNTGTGNGGDGSTATGTGGGTTGTGNGGTAGGTGGTDTGGGTGTGNGGATGNGGGATGAGGTTGGTSPDTGTGGGGTGTAGATATATGDGDAVSSTGGDTFKFRLKREIPTITNPNNFALNELARRVLISIDSVLVANSDEGACLRKSICETTKWSRTLDGRSRIVLPFLSLGMSWLSGRLVKSVAPSTAMIDALKASVLGLGNANCEIIYQDCDLRQEVMKHRRRRRRKRGSM